MLPAAGARGGMAAPLAVGVIGDAMGLRAGMAFLAAAPLVMMRAVARVLARRSGAESPS